MPRFVHFFHLSPAEYWALTLPEYVELGSYLRRWDREAARSQ
jgi:hypothetical protein